MNRETVSVADLIPGDIILPEGWNVLSHAYGVKSLPGAVVHMDKYGNSIVVGHYYGDPETQVQILR